MNSKRPSYVTPERLSNFIRAALLEDIGEGDHSTLSSITPDLQHKAKLIVKENCILAGIELVQEIYQFYDPDLRVEAYKRDGEPAVKGETAFVVSGPARSILTTERFVLNCLQRMSGIATNTRYYVELLKDTRTRILDTRKTAPLFRMCEKWAVHIGGGTNHRFGLFDTIMLKDNRIDYAGGIDKAVKSAVEYVQSKNLALKIEIETRNLNEVEQALATGSVDIIMLDNMSVDDMAAAVELIDGKAKTEASGNITKDTLKEIASTKVDYISSGSVIYAAKKIDLSLKAF